MRAQAGYEGLGEIRAQLSSFAVFQRAVLRAGESSYRKRTYGLLDLAVLTECPGVASC